jgi:hypothetical protein
MDESVHAQYQCHACMDYICCPSSYSALAVFQEGWPNHSSHLMHEHSAGRSFKFLVIPANAAGIAARAGQGAARTVQRLSGPVPPQSQRS